MYKTLIVGRIVHQNDRILFYAPDFPNQKTWDRDYRVISGVEDGQNVMLGDVIQYQPYGENFGFFVRKVQ